MSPAARNILSHLRVLVSLREIIIFFNPVDPVNPVQIRRILLTTEDSKSTKKEDLFSNLRVLRALCGKDSSSNLLIRACEEYRRPRSGS